MVNLPKLIDPFDRSIDYLRVSVTDRCDFRCVYCMSENMTFLPKKQLLSLEELDRICSIFIQQGIKKLRITGGEPLVRRGIIDFFYSFSRHLDSGSLKELTLTTNGSQLEKFAPRLAECCIKRINVSLDTLDPNKFSQISRWGRLSQVLIGIEAAQKSGIRIKINTVALKNTNEDELFSLTNWCASNDMDLTFIEVMPMGDIGNEKRLDQYWSLEELQKRLSQKYKVVSLDETTGGPASYIKLIDLNLQVGLITPLSHNFCESCNRVRLTCTGHLHQCLGQEDEADLRDVLRQNPFDDKPVIKAITDAIALKPKGHNFDYSRKNVSGKISRHMSHTGG